MEKFYEMANGNLIAEAGRGTSKKDIKKLQEELWVRRQGGICGIKEYTEPRAIFLAQQQNKVPLSDAIVE